MRIAVLAMIAAGIVSAALAQDTPSITIEDDVSRANAVKCAALRAEQLEVDKRRRGSLLLSLAMQKGAWDDYLSNRPQLGVPSNLKADVHAQISAWKSDPRYMDDPAKFLERLASDCEPFEIRG